MPTDGSGNIDGTELRRRLDQALTIAGDAIDHATANRITSYNVCYTKLLRTRGTDLHA